MVQIYRESRWFRFLYRQSAPWSFCLCLFWAGTVEVHADIPGDLGLDLVTDVAGAAVAVRHAGEGSGRLFIVQQSGQIRIHDGVNLLPTPFLNINSKVYDIGGEQGLLGLAFHPEYEENGFFYINYTYDAGAGSIRTRIERYSVSAVDPDVADPSSDLSILEIHQDFSNHNGGDIHFGPDGYLYIGMGDGGSGGDPNNRALDPTSLLGKMLRIDVDGALKPGDNPCGLVQNYGIPPDNPFQGEDPGDTCDEIWALGLRNPWRWSFDRSTGDLFIGDVGQNAVEEVNFQQAHSPGGENYGWSCMEGSQVYNAGRCDGSTLVAPILEHTHDEPVCSVIGGYRYRGPIPGLQELYIYGDYCSDQIWFASESEGNWNSQSLLTIGFSIVSFGEDENRNLYASASNGNVYRFDSSTASTCLGDQIDLSGDTVSAGENLLCIARDGITTDSVTVDPGGQAQLYSPGTTLGPFTWIKQGGKLQVSR